MSPGSRAVLGGLVGLATVGVGIVIAWRISAPAEVPVPPAPSVEPTAEPAVSDAIAVPGGRFRRGADAALCPRDAPIADVSAFALDRHEVSVARFRAFVEAGGGVRASAPEAGAGAHPRIPGSGWDPAWNDHLARDRAELDARLGCETASTWTATPGDDRPPINCVTWYEAFAFCVWDGGRLPTEAEWAYAAAGGEEERSVPWTSAPDASAERAQAVFGEARPFPVGSCSPAGDGRWGHSDLVGNVWEWTLDASPGLTMLPRDGGDPCSIEGMPIACSDCVGVEGASRVLRGGGFGLPARAMRVVLRRADPPETRHHVFGVRCARDAGRGALSAGPSPAPTTPAPAGGTRPSYRGFSAPTRDVTVAETLDVPRVARAAGTTRVLVVQACLWGDAEAIAASLGGMRDELAARDTAVLFVLTEGARAGQAADLIDVATLGTRLSLPFAVATETVAGGSCDRAELVDAVADRVVRSGAARDALLPGFTE